MKFMQKATNLPVHCTMDNMGTRQAKTYLLTTFQGRCADDRRCVPEHEPHTAPVRERLEVRNC